MAQVKVTAGVPLLCHAAARSHQDEIQDSCMPVKLFSVQAGVRQVMDVARDVVENPFKSYNGRLT